MCKRPECIEEHKDETKRCLKCEQNLPYTSYHRAAPRKDGHQPWCKTCDHAYHQYRHAATGKCDSGLRRYETVQTAERALVWASIGDKDLKVVECDVCGGYHHKKTTP